MRQRSWWETLPTNSDPAKTHNCKEKRDPYMNFLPYRPQGIARVLVVCPHTDDEFGCAGSILRFTAADTHVRYIALSRCEESVPEGFSRDILEKECRKCVDKLGIKPDDVEVCHFPVRHFPDHRQPILEKFVKLNREYTPDLVLMPSSFDTHQDHSTVFKEGFRAFKHASILGYELPQNHRV